MVRGHIVAALTGVVMICGVINGDCINEDDVAQIREKMQVELTGMREQMHWQKEINKLKLERIEVRFALIENKLSETLGSASNNEVSLALAAILQLSTVLENQKSSREDGYKPKHDDVTEQMSRLLAPKSASSENKTDKYTVNTTMENFSNSLSEMQTTLDDLQEKVEDIVASGRGVDQALATMDNTTTVTGLDQCRTMVEGLQVKVDELTSSRQQPQESGRDSVSKTETYSNKIKARDCHDIYVHGGRQDGVYKIFPIWNNTQSVDVWCEFDVGSEVGWTIILARMPAENPVNFSRDWEDYKAGFGDAQNEYWIGLSTLHQLFFKRHCSQSLQVNLHSWDLTTRHAQYKDFSIGDEESGFKLSVGGYSGDAGDAMANHNGMQFTTKDKDNDKYGNNCAIRYEGGFWHKACYHTHPFGPLRKKGDGEGMRWNKWLSAVNLKKIIFKISPRLPSLI